MKQIILRDALTEAAPRTTERSLYPDIDSTYSVTNYEGPRLIVRRDNIFGSKQIGNMISSLQGMAIYGDIIFRMANGTTHYVFRITPTGTLQQLASFSANTGHSNSLQFAPEIENGQVFPYLYVANLAKKCSVLSISATYAVSIVQTITIGLVSVASDCNLQIGDDGYMWCVYLDSNNHYHFIKFRRVSVSEGDVTLSQSDVVDEWTTQESYPYDTNVWQGMIVRNGQIWFSIGQTGAGTRGIVVYDTTTHARVTWLNLSQYNVELEDLDFWNDSVLVATHDSQFYQLKF